MKLMDESMGDEQEGFRRGRCVDQILDLKMIVEKYMGEDRKLYVAFIGLEMIYDK